MAFDPIGGLLKRLDQEPAWRSNRPFLQLCQQWRAVVGEALAIHTRPVAVHQGVLWVAVSNPAWAQTLTFERSRLVAKINRSIAPPFDPPLVDARFSSARWFETRSQPAALSPLASAGPSTMPDRDRPATAAEAFSHWAASVQSQLKRYDPCPQCGRSAPPAELDRWGVCGPCMVDQWSRVRLPSPELPPQLPPQLPSSPGAESPAPAPDRPADQSPRYDVPYDTQDWRNVRSRFRGRRSR